MEQFTNSLLFPTHLLARQNGEICFLIIIVCFTRLCRGLLIVEFLKVAFLFFFGRALLIPLWLWRRISIHAVLFKVTHMAFVYA